MTVEELTRENYFGSDAKCDRHIKRYMLTLTNREVIEVETSDNPLYGGNQWLKCETSFDKHYYINKAHIISFKEI